MSGGRRDIKVASTSSVLDEMYGSAPASDTPTLPVLDSNPPPVAHVSNTGTTEVQQQKDTARTRRSSGSNRVPDGKVKQTFYIAQDVVDELDAIVEQLGQNLRGLVPKHAILAAVLRAGIAQSGQVCAALRRELLQGLDADG